MRGRCLAALLALLQTGLLLHTAWDKSDTKDEPTYIAAAALLWSHGDFFYNAEAPVLPKWGFALGLRLFDHDARIETTPPEWWRAPTHILWSQPTDKMRRNLFAARCATIVATVLGGFAVAAAASHWDARTGLLAHALWVFSPTVLAHGSLATLDAWVASLLAWVLWASIRFAQLPNLQRAIGVGVLLGLAAACKVTSLLITPFLLIPLALGLGPLASLSARRRLVFLSVGVLSAFLSLWAVYGFTTGWAAEFRSLGVPSGRMFGPLPAPAWWEGLWRQMRLGQIGHSGYLAGEVRNGGWWWFYLAVIALKTTLGAQMMAALKAASSLRLFRSVRWRDGALLVFPAAVLLVMSAGRTQTGVRYLLPAFPFVFVWLSLVVLDASRAFGSRARLWPWIALIVAALGALRVHPDYLMFFNTWAGGPTQGPRYLIHSDDWGQDVRGLAEWQNKNRLDELYFTPYTDMPEKWGLRYRPVSCVPVKGIHALHAVEVHRPRRVDAGCLDWLTVEPPDQRIGNSIYIYLVPKHRLPRLESKRTTVTPFWRSGGD